MKALSPRISRVFVAFAHDVVMAGLSFAVALYLRLGELAYDWLGGPLFYPWLLFTTVCACAFWFTGLYRGIWRYASLNDMIAIARAVTLALLLYLPVTFMITRLEFVAPVTASTTVDCSSTMRWGITSSARCPVPDAKWERISTSWIRPRCTVTRTFALFGKLLASPS